jgi:hypothetical protein
MMDDSRRGEQDPGLCGHCVHAQIIRNDRGSTFFLCRRSATDPEFPKYPRLPVLYCRGFTPAAAPPGIC